MIIKKFIFIYLYHLPLEKGSEAATDALLPGGPNTMLPLEALSIANFRALANLVSRPTRNSCANIISSGA